MYALKLAPTVSKNTSNRAKSWAWVHVCAYSRSHATFYRLQLIQETLAALFVRESNCRCVIVFGHLDIWGDGLCVQTWGCTIGEGLSIQTWGWTSRMMERQQSSARTALWPSRPERLICRRRRSYIPAPVHFMKYPFRDKLRDSQYNYL